jgi:4-amino-4-deoxy-L-arabinose transferase-like glycosyltransferase
LGPTHVSDAPGIGRGPRLAAFAAGCLLLGVLYLGSLSRMGLVGPDEPRYADVGRAMAQSGDWVTPRLWGQPWFEKPALLYWMTATGFRFGLSPDLAPRLPVALLSLAFLVFFWYRVRSAWGAPAALFSTAILATSAGWLTYSQIAVTDLPLAVFFSSAVLLSLPWIERGETGELAAAAACLAMAALAKGLVPLVLFVPVVALRIRRLRDWLRPAPLLSFALIALPWYVLCTLRNGPQFLEVFFVQHHFERFTQSGLEHVQPWWFYLPILLALLFPWFPLMGQIRIGGDARLRALAAVLLTGFVFFSASVNKLPGYLLPLLPATAILIGTGLDRFRAAQDSAPRALVVCLALLGMLPAAAIVAPEALAHGLRSATFPWQTTGCWLAGSSLAALLLFSVPVTRRVFAPVVFGLTAAGFIWFAFTAFPRFDAAASARPVWTALHPSCASRAPRAILYGLYYYAQHPLPDCAVLDPGQARVVR